MKIEIELTEATAAQLTEAMKKSEWDNDVSDFCVFLIRNALSQILTLHAIHEQYTVPAKPEPQVELQSEQHGVQRNT